MEHESPTECSKQDQDCHHDVVAQVSLSLSLFFQFCKGAFSIPPGGRKRHLLHSPGWMDGQTGWGPGAWRGDGWWPGSAGTVMRIFARAERYPCTLPRYVPHQPDATSLSRSVRRGPLGKSPHPITHTSQPTYTPPMPVIMRLQQYCGRRRRRSQVVKINHPAHPARPLAPPFFSPYIVPRTIITANSLRLYWSRRPSH